MEGTNEQREERGQDWKEALRVERTAAPRTKPAADALGFGRHFTDHMLLINYTEGQGWHAPRIVPYAPLEIDPAAMVFHYGQTVFEGLKAYRAEDGRVLLFRPERNAARFRVSCERLCIPEMDEDMFVEAVESLVAQDIDWVPSEPGASLYIRPFIIATEAALGVRASRNYLFMIIMSPVGSYYASGMKPIDIHVEDRFVRAVRGGIGFAKTAANYAASLKAQELSKAGGSEQVLWLDAIDGKYIEEVGSMNVFFRIGDEVVTPMLTGSILEGVTRDSVMQLLASWGIAVKERRIAVEEIYRAAANRTLKEAFGTGTAAVVSPIGSLHWQGNKIKLNGGETGELAARLYDTLTGIQYGRLPDPHGWTRLCSVPEAVR